MTIEELRLDVTKCTACTARAEALIPVGSTGPSSSQIMFVGRNPGKQENYQGLPFVGRGGKLLDSFIEKANVRRNEIYITNLVKCHTNADRPPNSIEVCSCASLWLVRELSIVSPKLIVGFGSQVSTFFSGQNVSACRLREIYIDISPVQKSMFIACVHPGAALRSSERKAQMDKDAEFVKEVIDKYGFNVHAKTSTVNS